MYYRLKQQYMLRGWDKLPTGIVDTTSGGVYFETVENFRVLKMCTGQLNFDSILVSDEERKILENIRKYLDASEEPMERISGRQMYQKYENRFIRHVHWSITGRCNYRCRHCYMSAPKGVLGETSLDECRNIIDQMSECGIFSVSLTGGEALVHPHFWEIVDYILAKNIFISDVFSNGFLVNDETLSKFEERNIKPVISMSFDGTGGWHSWLRGIREADAHIESAFRLCRARGFHTTAEMCLHRGNLDRLEESIDYLAELGCSSVKVNRLLVEGNAVAISEKSLSIEETAEVFIRCISNFFIKKRSIGLQLGSLFAYNKNMGITIPGYKFEHAVDASRYCMCGHARNVMYITCEGRVLPCIPFESGRNSAKNFEKIRTVSLKSLLKDSYYFTCISTTLDQYFDHNPECAACEDRYHCAGGCRGCALQGAETYDFLAVDRETCIQHRKGYYRKVIELCRSYLGEGSKNNEQHSYS